MPVSSVVRELERSVPKRVAQERDRSIGMAGRLEYEVDRGPFSVALRGADLEISAPLFVNARACAKGSCYAGCRPEARAVVLVPLEVGPDYRLGPSRVELPVTRECVVRALGGFVTVNLTPLVQSGINAERGKVKASVDSHLPDLRSDADALWRVLESPQALGPGRCLRVRPERLVEGPAHLERDRVSVRIGLEARPTISSACDAPATAHPAPALAQDRALPEVSDVRLEVELDDASVARAVMGARVAFEDHPAQIRSVASEAQSWRFRFGGDACGDVDASSLSPSWSTDGQAVALGRVVLTDETKARLSGRGLDPAPVERSLDGRIVPLGLDPAGLARALPLLAKTGAPDGVDVDVRVSAVRPGQIARQERGLVATLDVVGEAHVTWTH